MAELDRTIQGYHQGVFWERNTLKAQKQNTTTPIASTRQSKKHSPASEPHLTI
jgi:hypothetical protein